MDMNEFIIGPPFEVTQFYAVSLTIIFSCFMYSSGMPILLWVGTIALAVQYWVKFFLGFVRNIKVL